MYIFGTDLKYERAFWATDMIEWDRVESVHPWYKFNDYWSRRVDYTPNAYGDTPYLVIKATIEDGEVVIRWA